MSVLDKITMAPLPTDQYYNEDTNKLQIYIHHTAGSPSPYNALEWWKSTPERVATAFIICGTPMSPTSKWYDGEILQCYGSSKWAHHLGLKTSHLLPGGKSNLELNKCSIGIEICNWGGLTRTSNGYVTYSGAQILETNVEFYTTAYKGFQYYQKYTKAQLESLHELLIFLCQKWKIPGKFNGIEIFNIDKRALMGTPGIYTHTSVRPDKSDCHPQPELLEVLKSI